MQSIVRLYSMKSNEIEKFLHSFLGTYTIDGLSKSRKQWQKKYPNPIEAVDIIGTYIENIDDYSLTMWISIDNGVFIKVTPDNADELIRYLYERFPY